ncbi:MAG TPA: PQQ-binding-like beta-propeller repeat protein [Terriglobales bacterium]|nr:PQQ-binding-like beta-propeller repeat protein [Terriglobales bacterium]
MAAFLLLPAVAAAQNGWLTWGYDQQRTGWNRSETVLTKENVSRLELKWKSQLSIPLNDIVLSTVTAPLVATVNGPQGPSTRVFVVGSDNTVYSLESETGEIVWQKRFPNTLTPSKPATTSCSNTQNATPVIDQEAGTIYVSTSDGKLRGLNLANGEERMPSVAFNSPFARNWSLNLIDGVIYTSTGRGCGDAMAHFTALDLKDPSHKVVEFYTSTGRPAGAWGRGGMVRGPRGIYAANADGPYDPASGKFGHSVMALSLKDLRLLDSFTPANWKYLEEKDLDLGSTSPSIFPFQKWTLVAIAGKESVVYLLDAANLGGSDHMTPLYRSPRWGNDGAMHDDFGVWGSMAAWQDAQGKTWLLMPMSGPPSKDAPKFKYTYGPADGGSIMAFEVQLDPATKLPTMVPQWISRDMHAPDPPVVANGVVYVLQTGKNTLEARVKGKVGSRPATNAVLFALDAETGRQLFSSEKLIESWAHFSEPVIVGGKIFVSTWDGSVYSFGLKK